jgi:hypothetical protein
VDILFLHIGVPIRIKAQLVEKFMLVKRLEEEEILLKKEMKNFLRFYLDKILPSLGEEKTKFKERIGILVYHLFERLFSSDNR